MESISSKIRTKQKMLLPFFIFYSIYQSLTDSREEKVKKKESKLEKSDIIYTIRHITAVKFLEEMEHQTIPHTLGKTAWGERQ